MTLNNLFTIANYYTNVNLAQGLTTNLSEIELALALNPNTFQVLALFDQAKGDNFGTSAFPTGWNGIDDYNSIGFSEEIWKTTGLGIVEASKLDSSIVQSLYDTAKQKKNTYAYLLNYLLNKTGSTYQQIDPQLLAFLEVIDYAENNDINDINFGISTSFEVLEEMQTGSPLSVDYLFDKSNSSDYFNQNPHAIFLSNHGGSYLFGGNGDGPENDLDKESKNLYVTEFSSSLKSAINTNSTDDERLAIIAYDECLMANIETITQLANTTRYLLASEEVVPGMGFDYFLTLSDFEVTTPLSTQNQIEDAAKNLGNTFVDNYSGRNGNSYTLSLTDTKNVSNLNNAIKNYAYELINSSDAFIISLLKSIRQKGTSYTFKFLQDLGNVALITKSAIGVSTELENASNSILSELNKTVINNNQNYDPLDGFKLNSSSGLTITLPTEFNNWRPGIEYNTQPSDIFIEKAPIFEESTGWSRVLDRITPLLSNVQTNSGNDSSKAELINADLTRQTGDIAFLALQIEGFLSYTSSNQEINQTKIKLPDFDNTKVADIELHLDILNLNSSGSIDIAIEDQDGQRKASWKQEINDSGLYTFIGADLSSILGAQAIELGDSIVITPDNTVAVLYDLDLAANGQSLKQLNFASNKSYTTPILLNSAAVSGKDYSFTYQTPIAPETNTPENGFFTTDIVLLSSDEGSISLKVKEIGSDLEVLFTSKSYIDEYIKLAGNSSYEFTFRHESDVANKESLSNISLHVDNFASETFTFKDAVLAPSIMLTDWGQYTINQDLNSSLNITEMLTNEVFNNLNDLREGQLIDADYGTRPVINTSNLIDDVTISNQTFFSGIWSSEYSYTFNTIIEGTSVNAARFGFFEVDDLTGAIKTDGGLIAASNSDAYKVAALDNLISPLVDLEGTNKSGKIEANIIADTNYAAILITTNGSGNETTLFSITGANPNQNAQLLNLGNGFFGWEDLVKGSDAGFDGDFNDITFYTT